MRLDWPDPVAFAALRGGIGGMRVAILFGLLLYFLFVICMLRVVGATRRAKAAVARSEARRPIRPRAAGGLRAQEAPVTSRY